MHATMPYNCKFLTGFVSSTLLLVSVGYNPLVAAAWRYCNNIAHVILLHVAKCWQY